MVETIAFQNGADRPMVSSTNPLPVSAAGLGVPNHDYIGMTYTGENLTEVEYKTGGAAGTVVATLTLAYTGDRLDSVTKS